MSTTYRSVFLKKPLALAPGHETDLRAITDAIYKTSSSVVAVVSRNLNVNVVVYEAEHNQDGLILGLHMFWLTLDPKMRQARHADMRKRGEPVNDVEEMNRIEKWAYGFEATRSADSKRWRMRFNHSKDRPWLVSVKDGKVRATVKLPNGANEHIRSVYFDMHFPRIGFPKLRSTYITTHEDPHNAVCLDGPQAAPSDIHVPEDIASEQEVQAALHGMQVNE